MTAVKINTPRGTAIWPRVTTPDTKFHELGMYTCNIAIPLSEAEKFMSQLSQWHKNWTGAAPKKSDNSLWKMEVDKETGEETGRVIFKIKAKNKIVKRTGQLWDRKPVLWDAKGNRVADVDIGTGSCVRAKVELYEWTTSTGSKGCSLTLLEVQIIDLVEFSGNSFDFDVEEDGFVMSEEGAVNGFEETEDEIPF